MFYDLNVSWKPDLAEYKNLQNTIIFLVELGYNVIALNHTLSGKLPADLTCPIPTELPFGVPPKVKILRRCTLVLSDPSQNHRLSSLANSYDILALRPANEKSLQQACQSLDCDIISLDLTSRLEYYVKMKMVAPAVERGIKFEICYGPGVFTKNDIARRNLISNATQLIRATRTRGLIISSEAGSAGACRGPSDIMNLAAIWGLGQEKGHEAVSKLARSVVVSAQLKRTSFRGVIDVVYGGEKPQAAPNDDKRTSVQKKRTAASVDDGNASKKLKEAPVVSKREQKRQRKVLLEAQKANDAADVRKTDVAVIEK